MGLPMKPASFRYFAPASVEEALALKAEQGDEARFLAGGQSKFWAASKICERQQDILGWRAE